MCSVAASLCTLKFNEVFREEVHNRVSQYFADKKEGLLAAYNKALKTGAVFNCRAFNVPKEDVCNCIIWRQQDATRNSIQALAQSKFSHITECGINWNLLETYKKLGTACYNRGEEHSDWVVDFNIPILTQDNDYINKHVFVGE